MRIVTCLGWLIFRRIRSIAFSVIGKNPMSCSASIAAEWRAICALVELRSVEPVVVERDAEGNVLWETKMGPMWAPAGMTARFVQMICTEMLSGVYDLSRCRENAVVVDAGANIGFFTRYALSQGAQKVIAFEPSPETAVCLRRNVAEWVDKGQVVIVEKGLWHEATVLRFSNDNKVNPGAHHITSTGEIEIHTTTLDACLKELGVDHIGYLKMDIEGAEISALRGGRKTLQKDHPVCAIAVEHGDDILQNALAVKRSMEEMSTEYRYVVNEAHTYESASMGRVLCPYAVQFYVPSDR